jgi:hypothetical protein
VTAASRAPAGGGLDRILQGEVRRERRGGEEDGTVTVQGDGRGAVGPRSPHEGRELHHGVHDQGEPGVEGAEVEPDAPPLPHREAGGHVAPSSRRRLPRHGGGVAERPPAGPDEEVAGGADLDPLRPLELEEEAAGARPSRSAPVPIVSLHDTLGRDGPSGERPRQAAGRR